ncbi:hypothetical protein JR316_0007353 [Psilocybe cubensis]|uniref:Uncharacterized protein n=2 Tax=Psilocybe cubensis TaxID=181762 RepID=A0ACB8GYD6_PSICU|nr:hypothetical protein JR316_0007353 [Psilocybe cubensis]KAH9480753.1 hypothetical protein JR316_0007353 [Psilocybe cubensis]
MRSKSRWARRSACPPTQGPSVSNYTPKSPPRIFLPLSKLEACCLCRKTWRETELRWCQLCAEVVYCSSECQQRDWPIHKRQYCGKSKTDRVDIESYWPFLAVLVAQFKEDTNFNSHPALTHPIINSPNPFHPYHPILNPSGTVSTENIPSASSGVPTDPSSTNPSGKYPISFTDGIRAKPIVLGEKLTSFIQTDTWWPTAITTAVRNKLQRRIANEGLLLVTYLSVCLSLLSSMYTTTAIPDDEDEDETLQQTGRRRIRLTYGNSPISDFGIVNGSVHVEDTDRLGYIFSKDSPDGKEKKGEYRLGQDPDDHYRFYFQTLSGSEWYLDLGKYALNSCVLVQAQEYCTGNWGRFKRYDGDVSGMFYGKEYEKEGGLDNFKLRRRFSILRNPRAHDIVQWNDQDADIANIMTLIQEIKGGEECTSWERETMLDFLPDAVELVHLNVAHRDYLNFPKKPKIAVDLDPDEQSLVEYTGKAKENVFKMTGQWQKRHRKGKSPKNPLEAAFRNSFK